MRRHCILQGAVLLLDMISHAAPLYSSGSGSSSRYDQPAAPLYSSGSGSSSRYDQPCDATGFLDCFFLLAPSM